MEKLIRSFIAIPLSSEIHKNLAAFMEQYEVSRQNGFRPVKAENIHLTLKFLGDASLVQLEKVKTALAGISTSVSKFDISISGVGAFPNWHQPRVVWVGLVPREELTSLFQKIDQRTVELGFLSEGRKFSPHLTLARVNNDLPSVAREKALRMIATINPQPRFGSMEVEGVSLFQSTLQPGGPVYTLRAKFPFS